MPASAEAIRVLREPFESNGGAVEAFAQGHAFQSTAFRMLNSHGSGAKPQSLSDWPNFQSPTFFYFFHSFQTT